MACGPRLPRGRRVVVIGSGATAVTLVPALAEGGASVTMLQRSPSYLFSLPARDRIGEALARILPRRWVLAGARQLNIRVARWLYLAARRWPKGMRRFLIGQVQKKLERDADMRHFTPAYEPWDQRLCIMPDADLLRSIRSGKASVVTGRFAGFDTDGVRLESGERLPADIVVAATGLELQAFGGMQFAVDGQPYMLSRHMLYRAVLLEDLPNFGWIVGYTNATWTLKADLATSYLCRLMKHMDAHGFGVAVARDREGWRIDDESLLGNLTSGYIRRGDPHLPRQGRKAPWRVTHDYFLDKPALLDEAIDDGILEFTPRREAAPATEPVEQAMRAAA